jgi:toxin FitB
MTFLVDANVLSEATKPAPDERVIAWLRANQQGLAFNPIVLGEIRYGILLMQDGHRRRSLERWFEEGVRRMQCLSWDAETGLRWAELLARLKRSGRAVPIKDSLIAATALRHDLIVATRNVTDFKGCGIRVMNPFAA